MKFRVKNSFYYNGELKNESDIVEVNADKIDQLKTINVLGEPIVEKKIERAVVEPAETRTNSTTVKKNVRKKTK